MKRCSRCGETKDRSAFARDPHKSDGLHGWCKNCTNRHRQQKRQARGPVIRLPAPPRPSRFAKSGSPPLVVSEPTPCYLSPDFFILEAEVEEGVAGESFDGWRPYLENAAQNFCAACPVAEQCLEQMRGGLYTGIAGGLLLINGREVAPRRAVA